MHGHQNGGESHPTISIRPTANSDVYSQADRAADRLVIPPSYLGRVEESAPFCCTTVGEKGREKKEQKLKASVRK